MQKSMTSFTADTFAAESWAPAPTKSLLERLKALLPAYSNEDRSVEHFIAQNGGVLTDSLEREISRRFGGHAGR
jgi:hypothetical protein